MNNQEILRKIVNYIENVMKEKSLTSRDLADICVKKTGKMSPRTIDNMFKTPSSTTLSTLLKVCEGLDLKEDISLSTSVKELAKLCNESNLEKTFHILNEDDRELSCVLKGCLATSTAPAAPSEAE